MLSGQRLRLLLESAMPHRCSVGYIAIAMAALVTPFVAANGDDPATTKLEETVIVASRIPTPLDRLGVSVSVTDRQTLELLGYNAVADFLDLQPGVSVTRDGGPGKAAAVRIRGEEGFRTRIVLDGIDIADPSSPQVSPRIEHLLTDGLQRIEVLRGPQGLAFGADAGGVIAMTTRQPAPGIRASFNAEGGENSFSRLGAFIAGGTGVLKGSLSVTDLSTDGFNARASDSQDPDRDGYDNTTAHGTAILSLGDDWSISGSFHEIDGSNQYDGCFDTETFAVINACKDDYVQSAWRLAARYQNGLVDSTLSYEQSDTERAFFSAGLSAFSSEGGHEEISWIGTLTPADGHRITLGTDASEMSLLDGQEELSRDNLGIWGEYGVDVLAGALTLGARFDDNDDFGQHTSWRISLLQQLTDGEAPLVLKGSIGTGFRAPSLYEISYNKSPYSFPDSDALREEESQGWELGVLWGLSGKQLELTWFDQEVEDEIYFYFDPTTFYSGYLQDAGTSRSKGLEFAGELRVTDQWRLSANATWNETETATKQQRPYRPEWTGAATVEWQGTWLSAAITGRFAKDSVDTLGAAMPDTERLDGSLIAAVSENLRLTARLENITDSRDAQVRDYNVMPRAFYLGLRYDI